MKTQIPNSSDLYIPNRHPDTGKIGSNSTKNALKLYRERTEHSQRDISIYTDISQSRISRLESLTPLHFIRAVTYFEIYSFNDYFNTFCNEVQTEIPFIDFVHMFTESNNFNIKYRI